MISVLMGTKCPFIIVAADSDDPTSRSLVEDSFAFILPFFP